MPVFLKAWGAVQVVGFVASGMFFERTDAVWVRWLFWIPILLAIGAAMLRHSKGAWAAAVILGAFALLGGLPVLGLLSSAETDGEELAWLLYGCAFAVADLSILFSRSARAWVNEPTTRAWTYTPRNKDLTR